MNVTERCQKKINHHQVGKSAKERKSGAGSCESSKQSDILSAGSRVSEGGKKEKKKGPCKQEVCDRSFCGTTVK